MALEKQDKSFRLPKISLLDFKSIEMDRVLTGLFARIFHKGEDTRLKYEHTVQTFLDHFLSDPERFRGFADHPKIVQSWLETHLLDLVNRGKPGQERVAAPRPLHGYTYRFRNPKHCKDYGAAQQLYEMLWHTRNNLGRNALDRLKAFFFEGIDQTTGQEDTSVVVDVETQALLSLAPSEVTSDAPLPRSREEFPPLCVGSAELLADDVVRLLQYRRRIPRSVMVEYLKILFAFHLSLYHLRLLKLLPELVRKHGVEPICQWNRCPMQPGREQEPQGDCPYQIGLFMDVRNHAGSHVAKLAEISADTHYRRIPGFVRAYLLTKKLDEWSGFLLQCGQLIGGVKRQLSVAEVLGLLEESRRTAREEYFGARLLNLTKEMHDEEGAVDPETEAILAMGLDKLSTYVECLMALRGDFQRSFIVKALDSLLLKNRPGAMIAQPRSAKAQRRFILDSRLLEVLLQIAVLRYDIGSGKYRSEEIQIDRLLAFLRERYGLYIDRLPRGEGFGEPSIEDREALRRNKEAFKIKLREIGFFQDLSDAYVTQHVTPRYRIGETLAAAAGGTG